MPTPSAQMPAPHYVPLVSVQTPRSRAAVAVPETDLPSPDLPAALGLPAIPEPGLLRPLSTESRPVISPIGAVRVAGRAQTETATPASSVKAPSDAFAASPGTAPDSAAVRSPPPLPPRVVSASRPSPPAQPPKVPQPPSRSVRPTSPAATITPPAGSIGSSGAPSEQAPGGASPSKAGGGNLSRTVYAKVGDDITIALDGEGWTFTGGGPTGDAWKGGVRYESRSVDSSGTTFIFKAKDLGKWVLDFQQQNASSGSTRDETINIHVLTGEEFAKTIAEKSSGKNAAAAVVGATAGGAAGGDLAAADWLYKEGKYREALDAYERAWVPNDPALTDKIAELAYRVGRYGDAREYWQKNYGMRGTDYGELAVAGLMKTATAQKDTPELRALFDDVHALHGIPLRSDLLDAARFLYESKDWDVALRYLDEYLSRYNGQQGADAADYLLGQIYQGDTPMQDAQKAMDYYRKIVTHYPASDYYERAKTNMVYLNRHFFEIR